MRFLKKLAQAVPAILVVGMLGLSAVVLRYQLAHGEPIEGFDPNGNFKTVGVSASGHLLIDQNGNISQFVVWSGSPTVTAIQGTSPWIVGFNAVGQPVNATQVTSPWVVGFGGVAQPVTNTAATYATVTTAQQTCNSSDAQLIAASASTKATMICNNDLSNNVWLGPSGITTATGHLLRPGACFTPDGPLIFQGRVDCITTNPQTAVVSTWIGTP